MPNVKDVQGLIDGFKSFRERHFERDNSLYEDLVEHGQNPKVAIVACVDSRVSPTALLNAPPGSLYVFRSVANHIPLPNPGMGENAAIAALEYAILGLKVEHLIVMGHSLCGGIAALMKETAGEHTGFPFVAAWMSSLEPVCESALHGMTSGRGDPRAEARAVEQASIVASLENLQAYPWVKQRVDEGLVTLHGWYFDMQAGELWVLRANRNAFVRLVG